MMSLNVDSCLQIYCVTPKGILHFGITFLDDIVLSTQGYFLGYFFFFLYLHFWALCLDHLSPSPPRPPSACSLWLTSSCLYY